MTTLSSKLVRAKKKHRCDYCGGIIHEKELYKNTAHVYDGQAYSHKSHKYCDELTHQLNMWQDPDVRQEGLSMDWFQEMVVDKFNHLTSYMLTIDVKSYLSEVNSLLDKLAFRDKMFFVIRQVKIEEKENVHSEER